MTVLKRIEAHYDEIFSAEKKVADYILKNPEDAVNANVSELANCSGVSDATVIRFCKHIGYQGYYQLKIALSRDLGRKQVEDLYEGYDEDKDSVSNVFRDFANNIVDIGNNFDKETMLTCAELIRSSTQVHIIAVGNTSPLAQYMGFRLGRLGVRCTYNMVAECFMNHVNLAEPTDIVIAISQSGSSRQVVQGLELAKERKLKIIAITAYKLSPVSRLADYLLFSNSGDASFNYYRSYSHLNETAVIDALLHFVTNEERIAANDAYKPEIILSEYKL